MTTVEPSRRERKKGETRHRIFHAAIDLFREKGYEQTTVDDITERADVAKGTFFNYFPRKDAVLRYLSEERLSAIEADFPALLAQDRSSREKLAEVYMLAAAAYEEDRDLARFVLVELMRRAFAPHEETAVRWHDVVRPLIEQGKARGELRPDVPFERSEMLLTGIYFATLYQWTTCRESAVSQLHPADFDLREELAARITLVMEGFAS
jgi:TetR/AcrR family transcriptional regulator, cholesterol catabolism regulator